MRLLMYATGTGPRAGVVEGDSVIDLQALASTGEESLPRDLVGLIELGDSGLTRVRSLLEQSSSEVARQPLAGLMLLAPLDPPRGNILALGHNYQAHAEELARAHSREDMPLTVFTKAQTTVAGPNEDIPIDPRISAQMDWEVELGVVTGRRGKNISQAEAFDHVFGYTVVNDVTARDMQYGWGGQYFKGKSLDKSCPMGPWLVTRDELPNPHVLSLRLRINGETKQDGHTSRMIHRVDELLAQLSLGMTLLPGMLIATGTPPGVGFARIPQEFLQPGDVMESEVEGIGLLRNQIVRSD